MPIWNRICDCSNLNFAFGGSFFFNIMFFLNEQPYFLMFYLAVLAVNIYVCYVIIKLKDRVSRDVMRIFENSIDDNGLTEEQCIQLEKDLERSLQLGDLAEVSFGRFGRIVTESAVFLCITSMVVSQMCTVRLLFITTAEYANSSSSGADLFWPFNSHELYNVSAFAAIFLPIFLVFSLLPSYRSLAPLSIVGIVAIIIGSGTMLTSFITVQNLPNNSSSSTEDYYVYVFESASPQIGLLLLTLSNSAAGNRRGFMYSLLAASVLSFCWICFTGLGLLFFPTYNKTYPLFMKLSKKLPQNIIVLMGYVAFCFILNIPLFDLFERWISKLFRSRPSRDGSVDNPSLTSLDLYDGSTRISIFGKLRLWSFQAPQGQRLTLSDVYSDIRSTVPKWLSVLLRLLIVTAQWAMSCLCWEKTAAIVVFIGIEMVSTIFVGYVLPFIQFLRLQWFEIHVPSKILSSGIILATLAVTIVAYIRESNLFRHQLSKNNSTN